MTPKRVPRTFCIGVLGNFIGRPKSQRIPFRDSHFLSVTRETIADVFSSFQIELRLSVPDEAKEGEATSFNLKLSELSDFAPAKIAMQVPQIAILKQLDSALAKLEASNSILPRLDPADFQSDQCRIALEQIDKICDQISWPSMRGGDEITSALDSFWNSLGSPQWFLSIKSITNIVTLRKLVAGWIQSQIEAVTSLPEFRELQATWCGLLYLLEQLENQTHVQVKILNATKDDISRDLNRAAFFDNSQLFRKIYTEMLDTPGALPLSVLVGAYEFDHHPEDMDFLSTVSGIAAASWCPFIAAASPTMFGIQRFRDIHVLKSLASQFSLPEYTKWHGLRAGEDSRFITLCVPKVFLDQSVMMEDASMLGACKERIACNGAFVLAAWLGSTQTFDGWCLPRSGVETGIIPGLLRETIRDSCGEWRVQHRTNVVLEQAKSLEDLEAYIQPSELIHFGFLPICQSLDIETCVLHAVNSIAFTTVSDSTSSGTVAQARLTASLEYVLPLSLLAQHIKSALLGQDFRSDEDFKGLVVELIQQCITPNAVNANERFPFSDAEVLVQRHGGYQRKIAVVRLTLSSFTADPGQVLSLQIF